MRDAITNDDPLRKHRLELPVITHRDERRSGLPSKLEPGLQDSLPPSVENWLVSYHIPRIIQCRLPKDKYTVPATTSQDIGWRWDGRKTLEVYGSHARGQGDVLDWFGAREAMP